MARQTGEEALAPMAAQASSGGEERSEPSTLHARCALP